MVLAEVQHQAAPRGQRPARARGEEDDEMNNAMGQTTPPSNAATTEYYPLTSDEGGGMAAGGRPPALAEPRPQAGIQQNAGIGYELVFADAPMLHFHDEDIALGAFLEQVTFQEIPEVQVPSSTVSGRFLEQEVDVPVRDAAPLDVLDEMWNRWWMFPSQCLWYWISSSHKNEHSNDLSSKSSTHMSHLLLFLRQLWNRRLMFPYLALLLVLHAFCSTKHHLLALQLPGWMLHRSNSKGFCPFSPEGKSATVTSQSTAELVSHSSLSAPSAQSIWIDGDVVWTRCESAQGAFWVNLSTRHTQWHPPWESR